MVRRLGNRTHEHLNRQVNRLMAGQIIRFGGVLYHADIYKPGHWVLIATPANDRGRGDHVGYIIDGTIYRLLRVGRPKSLT